MSALYPGSETSAVDFEAPRRPEFGDFATNAAFALAKRVRTAPQAVATALLAELRKNDAQTCRLFSQLEATAGFLNLRLAPECWHAALAGMLSDGTQFGSARENGSRISLEFGSANPTGPLVVVQGRTTSIGQTLADIFRFRGYGVFTEWIINDAGAQMETLARSLFARYRQIFDSDFPLPAESYPGEYLIPIAQRIESKDGRKWVSLAESEWLPYFTKYGRDGIVAEQKQVCRRFGVHFDLWQSEKELHASGKVKETVALLTEKGLTYEQENALYFKATQFADDKDRVIIRSDGRPTYLAQDIAYHYDKLQRSDRVIDILGPDHHGYIDRLQGIAAALGFPDRLDVLIAQQVTLLHADEVVSMSKRAGAIIPLDEIIDEVGVDAARFFFIMLAPGSPLKFDVDLAKEQSNDNPVYYVQYGHARIASVFRNALPDDVREAATAKTLQNLTHAAELALIGRLWELPSLLDNILAQFAPHRLAHYARDVASDFHQFYSECKILTEERDLRVARLALCLATRSVLATVLRLAGVSAPETM